METFTVAPPNSLLLIEDPNGAGQIPETMAGGLTAATNSIVAVGTRAAADGDTRVRVGTTDEIGILEALPPILAFDGVIDTPGKVVEISSVIGEKYASMTVPSSPSRIRIWVNDLVEPSELVLVVGDNEPGAHNAT